MIINNIHTIVNHLTFEKGYVYILLGMQRHKDNDGIGAVKQSNERKYPEYVKRYVIHSKEDYYDKVEKLLKHAKSEWKNFRIYITHNPRSLKKGYSNLHSEMFRLLNENESLYLDRLKSLEAWWRTYLHRPEAKAKTIFHMLDIDLFEYPDIPKEIEVVYTVKTKNGYHSLCKPFNPAIISGYKGVTFNQDSLVQIYSN